MAKNLGKVGFALKGEWSSVVTYDQLEVVFYEGKVYAAKRSSTNAQPDSSPADWMMWAGSPVITSSAITGGHAVTITNADGTSETINVLDGEVTNAVLSETLDELIGKLSNLTTTDKSNVVAAINELDSDVDELQEGMETKAEIDGYYEDLTAGSAEQLISSVAISDNAPYNFRTSGGNVDIGNRETDKLVGGTVAWNQKYNYSAISTETINDITFTVNSDGTIVANGTASADAYKSLNIQTGNTGGAKIPRGHKFYMGGCPSGGGSSTYCIMQRYLGGSLDTGNGTITWDGNSQYSGGVVIFIKSGVTVNNLVFKPIVSDLTQMFGSAIADHIYALETANAGAGVAWFRKYFPKDYYAYNAGQLLSVKTSEHKTTGFNQWDEEWELVSSHIESKNYIMMLPDTVYHWTAPAQPANGFVFYDVDKNIISTVYTFAGNNNDFTTPSNCAYAKFKMGNAYGTTYKNDICINLHWDGERDGEYEAYEKHSYALDSDLELRGIPKLDENDELYYDGDTYESNGTVTRNYGIVDLGTLSWTSQSSATQYSYYSEVISGIKKPETAYEIANIVNAIYRKTNSSGFVSIKGDKAIAISTSGRVNINDNSYSDATAFKTAMSGVYLVYELATPTTESADPYTNPQIVNDWGTEEYVDIRDVQIPVGHETLYQANLKAKLEMAPNSPSDGDGDYIVRQTNGENAYVKLVKELPVQPNDTVDYALKSNSGSLSWQKYDEMIVGNAKQLISSVGIEDQVPYNFRTSGGSNDIGTLEEDTIVGGTLVWNQLYPTPTTQVAATKAFNSGTTFVTGHKMLHIFNASKIDPDGSTPRIYVYFGKDSGYSKNIQVGSALIFSQPNSVVADGTANNNANSVWVYITNSSNCTWNSYVMYDLTQMFGSTIADYIYNLEQANTGAGVAWFRKYFPKPYYAYNAGGLMSVKTSAHQMTRFNQWDEEWEEGSFNTTTGENASVFGQIRAKNLIPILGGVSYRFTSPKYVWMIFYDASKSVIPTPTVPGSMGTSGNSVTITNGVFTTPSNASYMRFYVGSGYGSTYQNDICINLHWDGERDGEYEPYELISYPLDSDLELKGIPKLDASNNLYYDGDIYEPDGTVTRKYGIVDLGTLTWKAYTMSQNSGFWAQNQIPGVAVTGGTGKANAICVKYPIVTNGDMGLSTNDKVMAVGAYYSNGCNVYLVDSAYSGYTGDQVKSALSGVYLIYELATPTTEEADPYTTPQMVDDWGTEEYVDTRDVPIPVGHKTFYQANLKAKLEMAPDSPGDGDGLYAVRQTDGENSYEKIIFPTELPAAPTTDGSYRLKVTVTNGTPVLSWESIS